MLRTLPTGRKARKSDADDLVEAIHDAALAASANFVGVLSQLIDQALDVRTMALANDDQIGADRAHDLIISMNTIMDQAREFND